MKAGTPEWNDEMFGKHATPNSGIAGWIEKQRGKKIMRHIDRLKPSDTFKLIEIGCEAGNLLKEIEKKFPEATLAGSDISQDAVLQANDVTKNAVVTKHNIVDEPHSIKDVDFIVCSEVLEHIPEDEKAIANIAGTCGENTVVIITVPYERIKNIIKSTGST